MINNNVVSVVVFVRFISRNLSISVASDNNFASLVFTVKSSVLKLSGLLGLFALVSVLATWLFENNTHSHVSACYKSGFPSRRYSNWSRDLFHFPVMLVRCHGNVLNISTGEKRNTTPWFSSPHSWRVACPCAGDCGKVSSLVTRPEKLPWWPHGGVLTNQDSRRCVCVMTFSRAQSLSILNTSVLTGEPERCVCVCVDLACGHHLWQCWRFRLFIINSAWYFPHDPLEGSSYLEGIPGG